MGLVIRLRHPGERVRALALVVPMLVLTGCATVAHVPAARTDRLRSMKTSEARRNLLTSARQATFYFEGRHVGVADLKVRSEGLDFLFQDAKKETVSYMCLYTASSDPTVTQDGIFWIDLAKDRDCQVRVIFGRASRDEAIRFADAVYILRHRALGDLPAAGPAGDDAAFRDALRYYRSQTPRPELPEAARRFAVQAAAAMKDKNYEGAIDLYERALDIAPWWPDGRFNRALLFAQEAMYKDAIAEMNRYLELVPEAPDARAARDKIYEWERPQRAVTIALPPGPLTSTPPASDGCFIATAVYGSALHPHVAALRAFRDRQLLGHPVGRAFVRWYYATGPMLARHVRQHEILRVSARVALTPIVYAVVHPGPTALTASACAVVLCALLLRRSQRRARRASTD